LDDDDFEWMEREQKLMNYGNLKQEDKIRLREIKMDYERDAGKQLKIIREAKAILQEVKNRRNRETMIIETTAQLTKGPTITINNEEELIKLQKPIVF
jgi:hypothetical protein